MRKKGVRETAMKAIVMPRRASSLIGFAVLFQVQGDESSLPVLLKRNHSANYPENEPKAATKTPPCMKCLN